MGGHGSKVLMVVPLESQEKVKVLGLTGLLSFLREISSPKKLVQKTKEKLRRQRLNFTEAYEFSEISDFGNELVIKQKQASSRCP